MIKVAGDGNIMPGDEVHFPHQTKFSRGTNTGFALFTINNSRRQIEYCSMEKFFSNVKPYTGFDYTTRAGELKMWIDELDLEISKNTR
jgi:hypothetical protein